MLFEQVKPKQSLGKKIKGHLKRNWGKYATGAASLGAIIVGDRLQDKGETQYHSSITKRPRADWKKHRPYQVKRDIGKNLKLAGLGGLAATGAYDYTKKKFKKLSNNVKNTVENNLIKKKSVNESTLIFHTDGTKVKWDMTKDNKKRGNDK